MRKLLLALALLLAPTGAWAQCNGVFAPNTLCGNLGATPAPPGQFSASGTIVGPSSSTSGWIPTWGNNTGTLLGNQSTITTSQAITLDNGLTVNGTTSFTSPATFSGTTNFTSQFQVGGQRFQFPAAADTVGGLGTNQTWTGTNSFTGVTFQASASVATLNASTATLTTPLSPSQGGTGHTSSFIPTYTILTTGTALAYTPPTNPAPIYILVEMCGAGGGGGAQVTNAGTAGTSTFFGNWSTGPGNGGASGTANSNGGTGGTGGANGVGTQVIRQAGGRGGDGGAGGAGVGLGGGLGGISFLGGYGASQGAAGGVGNVPQANSCGGGGGGGSVTAINVGAGGGAGEYARFQLVPTVSAYTYTIGSHGSGGTAGTNAGGNGADGIIIVREFYQ